MTSLLKFDLGGIGPGRDGYSTVNLAVDSDIKENIVNLDSFCEDNTVDEFFLSHTLEHIHVTQYRKFLLDMKRKLKPGGIIKVIQTDAGKVIKMWINNEITFRSMRTPIFTPASRCSDNLLQQHQSMWSQEELIKDFNSIDMVAEGFDAGSWAYDLVDDMIPLDTLPDFNKQIPNLGVIARKK